MPQAANLPASSAATLVEVTDGPSYFYGLDFADGSDLEAQWCVLPLHGYDGRGFRMFLGWYADTVTSGNLYWQTQVGIGNESSTAPMHTFTFLNAFTGTDAHLGTIPKRFHEATMTNTNDGGIANDADYDGHVRISMKRLAAQASDTLSDKITVVYLAVEYDTV